MRLFLSSLRDVFCGENKAPTTNVFCAKAQREPQLRQGEIDK